MALSLLLMGCIPLGEQDAHVVRWAIPEAYSQRPHLAEPIRVVGLLTRVPGCLFSIDPAELEWEDWCGEGNEDDPWLEPVPPAAFPPLGWRSLFRR